MCVRFILILALNKRGGIQGRDVIVFLFLAMGGNGVSTQSVFKKEKNHKYFSTIIYDLTLY